MTVFYRVPDISVSCEWVVLLDGSGEKGTVLDANADAARYLLKKLAPKEAAKLIATHPPIYPIYPPMARAAHVTGAVRVTIHVSSSGAVDKMAIIDGPEMLRSAAEDAVRKWSYHPLMIGSTPVAFQTVVTVNFHMSG